jgi:hypothetical protein
MAEVAEEHGGWMAEVADNLKSDIDTRPALMPVPALHGSITVSFL